MVEGTYFFLFLFLFFFFFLFLFLFLLLLLLLLLLEPKPPPPELPKPSMLLLEPKPPPPELPKPIESFSRSISKSTFFGFFPSSYVVRYLWWVSRGGTILKRHTLTHLDKTDLCVLRRMCCVVVSRGYVVEGLGRGCITNPLVAAMVFMKASKKKPGTSSL